MFRFVDRPGDFVDLTSRGPTVRRCAFSSGSGSPHQSISSSKEVDAGGSRFRETVSGTQSWIRPGTFKLQMFAPTTLSRCWDRRAPTAFLATRRRSTADVVAADKSRWRVFFSQAVVFDSAQFSAAMPQD